MAKKKPKRKTVISDEEAERWVEEQLRPIDDRHRHIYALERAMAAENEILRRLADGAYTRDAPRSPGEDRVPCPHCRATGFVDCHVCDGLGRYFGPHGLVDPCRLCKGQKRIPCTRYGCEGGYVKK